MENEIKFLTNRVSEDKKKIEELRYKEENEKLAAAMKAVYDSFIEKGFSDEQAFWVVAQFIKRSFKNC